MVGLSLAAGGANVIMQLSRLPVGRAACAESRVESGRVDRRPIKRLRTTTAFLVIAMLGTEEERAELASADRSGARAGPLRPGRRRRLRRLRPRAAALGGRLPLQGPRGRPPAVRARPTSGCSTRSSTRTPSASAPRCRSPRRCGRPTGRPSRRTGRTASSAIEMDDVTRAYLRTIADLSFVGGAAGRARPAAAVAPPAGRRAGDRRVPPAGVPRRARAAVGRPPPGPLRPRAARVSASIVRRLPAPLREFPLNLYLRDTKHRLRTGRPVI